jgi:hypothetical protein
MDITQVTPGSVAMFHLISGQNVVGRVKEKDGASITLLDPVELVLMMHPENPSAGPVIALVPFLSMANKLPKLPEVSIHLSHILTPREVPERLERDYTSSISGLDLTGRVPGNSPAGNGGRFRTP